MKLQISGIDGSKRDDFLGRAKNFLNKTQGPLRLADIIDKEKKEKILFLRERTWGEFLLEKLILTPQEMEDLQNEVLSAIELAFSSLAEEPKACEEKKSRATREREVPCLDESADVIGLKNSDNDDYNDKEMGAGAHASTAKDQLIFRVLHKKKSTFEFKAAANGRIRSLNGLVAVPKGISVSTCPALQVIAHNVVANNINAERISKVERFSPLERALEAFQAGWRALGSRSPVATGSYCKMPLDRGLRHIQNLYCLADEVGRDDKSVFENQDEKFWKDFYLKVCGSLNGSIVMELYPDFYEKDKKTGDSLPRYSEENIKGAVAAAFKLGENDRGGKREAFSFMFAGMSLAVSRKICDQIRIRSQRLMEDESQKCDKSIVKDEGGNDSPFVTDKSKSYLRQSRVGSNRVENIVSPTKKFLNNQFSNAKKQTVVMRNARKVEEISGKIRRLSNGELAEVLNRIDENNLYDALEIVVAGKESKGPKVVRSDDEKLGSLHNRSAQHTHPAPPHRPVLPENIPTPPEGNLTPKTISLRAAIKKSLDDYKKNALPPRNWNLDADVNL